MSKKRQTDKCEHLSDVKDDVGVLVVLVGVDALSVIPEQISTGRAVIRESRDQVERLTTAYPQGQVGHLCVRTSNIHLSVRSKYQVNVDEYSCLSSNI